MFFVIVTKGEKKHFETKVFSQSILIILFKKTFFKLNRFLEIC